MSNKVLIVESPNKVKTIQKYVGDDYQVLSSVGHILKLSTSGKSGLGINFETWEPIMIQDSTKSKIIKELKDATKDADEVLIATDPDREGEAIARNLIDTLKVENKYKRIKYNEITKDAIEYALNNPLTIDENLVNAQKTRRMLDRIIGFRLSELMKRKVKNSPTNPSAGRVQSIALKLVCDKENEIEAFIPIKYSKIDAQLQENYIANFYYAKDSDFSEDNTWIKPEKSLEILNNLEKNKTLKVTNYKVSQRKEAQIIPFKQSILYKEAKYSASTVQHSAQKLFEQGLISYPRTDSTRMSNAFITKAREYISQVYGKEYVANDIKGFSGDQDAHEAIRPTDIYLTPEEAKSKNNLNEIDSYIYTIIYNKTISSLMIVPIREIYHYDFVNGEYNFKLSSSKVIFDGYYKIYGYENAKPLPNYQIGDIVPVENFVKFDKETQPPARYNDGSLIKMLDDIKVGRPSTFASTVNVIKKRMFVETKNGALHPTEFGKTVMQKLLKGFPDTITEEYTASVEEKLDSISEGVENYKSLLKEFWDKFNENYDNVTQTMEISILPQNYIEDEVCPLCGNKLLYRYTKTKKQKFIGCSNFPACKYLKNIDDKKRRSWKKYSSKSTTSVN
ncbi:type I DNA topoisomerase [Metamycoplasma buccale]|uniref:type I DNA topoisomerase n=1 Tax=Metamycoplasma buccale TaxID=55602 RepID=UPI00398EF01C